MAVALSNITLNWANSSFQYNGMKINVLDGGSEANSRLIDIQANSISYLSVGKTGNVSANVILVDQVFANNLNVVTTNINLAPVFVQANDAYNQANTAISYVPPGALFPYAGTTEPSGFLFCSGNAVSRTTYSALFAAIGTTYGVGNGSTTFNLPDLRGRVIAGKDNMSGTAASRLTSNVAGSTLGATGGVQSHIMTTDEMPLHGHPTRVSTGTTAADGSGGIMLDTGGDANYAAYTGTPTTTAGQQVGGTGGGQSHNNVQPTIILNYIIKT